MHWENSLLVDAPVDAVWALTVDIASWPTYLPTVRRVQRLDQGPLHEGSSARLWQPVQTAAVWTVTTVQPGREFTWRARRPGAVLTATHLLEDVEGRCRNTLVLDLTGPSSGVLSRVLGRLFARVLATENAALKARAEQAGEAGAAGEAGRTGRAERHTSPPG